MTGTVFRIERFAIHDGPGIRTTVFLKGCPLRCAWCHSPESQSPGPEFMPLPDRCIGCGSCVAACPHGALRARPLARSTLNLPPAPAAVGARPFEAAVGARPFEAAVGARPFDSGARKAAGECRFCGACVEACPTGARVLVGEQMSVEAVVAAIERDRVFYDESGGGVTFSGGEPLMQAPFVAALVDRCRSRRMHVAIDTSGFGDPRALDTLEPDLFLFDVKAVDDARHREITGVSNRVILDNLGRLAARTRASGARATSLIVRFPLVPGVNDSDDNVGAVGHFLSSLGIPRIDVLPYHRAGLAKYDRLGRPYALADTAPPTAHQIERAARLLSDAGLTVRVGGA